MSSRRVVIVSPGGKFTDDVLALLKERGTPADALLLYAPPVLREWRKPATRAGRMAALARTPLRWARVRVRQRAHARAAADAGTVIVSGTLNGERMKRDLRRLDAGVAVLARCGLVGTDVLSIPREGVVNVHPGVLPWIRGNSPVANSLIRGVPLGATAFRVDAGIDTGAIITRRLVRLHGGETVDEVRAALYRLWVEMTADLVADAKAGRIASSAVQEERFPLCRTVTDPAQLAAVDKAVLRGDAKALLDRWAPLCDLSTLALPADVDASLVTRVAG
ncbi:MAG TPA: formyltransferase family protein [Longimicrobiaceae bacterium]|jgi:folate-dependent phosphoribosylglycinamide formyltransferase PurN|nr:formyltransferase family protein [Longimicrobiaceae bacterium]